MSSKNSDTGIEDLRKEVLKALEPLAKKYFIPSELLRLSFTAKISKSPSARQKLAIQLLVLTAWKAIENQKEEELLALIGIFALQNISPDQLPESIFK